VDRAGNVEALRQEVYTIDLDVTPPITTIYPSAGTYPAGTLISFLRNEPAATWYCLIAGCEPNVPYVLPLTLISNLTVNFYSVDQVGNTEAMKTAVFTVSGGTSTPPTVVMPPVTLPPPDGDVATTSTSTPLLPPDSLPAASYSDTTTSIQSGGGYLMVETPVSATTTATITPPVENATLLNLKLQVIELQRSLINLFHQLIEHGRRLSAAAASGLAAVGSLFSVGFGL